MNRTLQDLLNEGAGLIRAGRLPEAEALAQQLLQRHGDNTEVRYFASDVESLRGDPVAALAHLDALSEAAGSSPRILLRKAELLLFDGRRKAALAAARAVDVQGADERALLALARVFIDSRKPGEAADCLRRALERFPASVSFLYLLAVAEAQLDQVDAAQQHLEQVLEQVPQNAGALHLRSQLKTWSADENHLEALREAASGAGPQLAAMANYALGKEYEDLGDYPQAFAAYSAGAAAYRGLLSYDGEAELAAQRAIRERFTAARLAALAHGCEDPAPIFLVGMPRSGIGLTGRLLGAHSEVESLGEFRDFRRLLGVMAAAAAPDEPSDAEATLAVDFAELGRRYVEAARELAGDSPRFVDGAGYNFLYCGHILAALPNARIVHVTRDPLDTCYCAFKTLFFGSNSFSYDLEELADYYLGYRAQMQHWHALFPGRILDVSYEQLVRESVVETRRLLDFCGLAWEERLLSDAPDHISPLSISARLPALHDRGVGAWTRAGESFAALRARLADAGIAPV